MQPKPNVCSAPVPNVALKNTFTLKLEKPLAAPGARESEGKLNHVSVVHVAAGGTDHVLPRMLWKPRWKDATLLQLLRMYMQKVLLGCSMAPQLMGGGSGTHPGAGGCASEEVMASKRGRRNIVKLSRWYRAADRSRRSDVATF